jgi:hypothetical protein
VNRKRGIITVRRSRVAGVDGTPKSGHGRAVPIAAPLLPHLEQARNRKKGPWDNVSLTRYGKPWGDGGLTQAFERARDRVGLSDWTFHHLRHHPECRIIRSLSLLPGGFPAGGRSYPLEHSA